MAVLTAIRNQTILVISVLGIALIGFIASDYFANGGGQQGPGNVGTIGGEDISSKDFEMKVEKQIENYKERSGEATLPAGVADQIRTQVWNEYEQENVLIKPATDKGVVVTGAELYDLVHGENPHSIIVQNFTDPNTGQFNPDQVTRVRNQMLEDTENGGAEQWTEIEQAIKKDRQTAKYYALINKGLYVTTIQAEQDIKQQNTKASITYAAKRYTDISDAEVKVSDADLNTYYNAHKQEAMFLQDEAERGIEYVSFSIVPTADDTAAILENMNTLKKKFKETSVDTAFVQSYATEKQIKYYTTRTVPVELDTVAFKLAEKEVAGPIFDRVTGRYKLVKLLDVKTASDSVKARHILVQITGDTLAAQNKADSLMNVIATGSMPFEIIAMQNSADAGSKDKGGDLGWFQEGQMIAAFNDAAFSGKAGDVVKVMSPFGIHIIKIEEKTDVLEKRLLAIIDQAVEPSSATIEDAYNKASAFSINTQEAGFNEKAQEVGLKIADRIKESDKNIQGLGSRREIVKWVYANPVETVSEPFELENRFIVAKVSSDKPAGTLSLEAVKEQVQDKVMKEKKAEKIKSMVSGTDLNAAANAWATPIDTADNISFKSFSIPGIGNEFNVIGRVFSLQKGAVSKPIAGEFGVYVVKLNELSNVPNAGSVANQKNTMKSAYQRRVSTEAYKVLKDFVGVEDSRAKFY